jgi:hypothetical protein
MVPLVCTSMILTCVILHGVFCLPVISSNIKSFGGTFQFPLRRYGGPIYQGSLGLLGLRTTHFKFSFTDTSVPIFSLALPQPNVLCRNRQPARRVSYIRGTKWGSSAALTAWGGPTYRNGSTGINIRGTLPTLRKQSKPFTVKAV